MNDDFELSPARANQPRLIPAPIIALALVVFAALCALGMMAVLTFTGG